MDLGSRRNEFELLNCGGTFESAATECSGLCIEKQHSIAQPWASCRL